MSNDNTPRPAYMSTPWFEQLVREVKASTQAKVAARMGISRVTLTIFLNGKGEYGNGGAKPDRMEMRYRKAFEQLLCPHDGETVGVEHCRSKALGTPPTHNPLQLGHWKACQACQFRPAPEKKVELIRRPRATREELPMAALDTRTLPLPEVGAPQIKPATEEVA